MFRMYSKLFPMGKFFSTSEINLVLKIKKYSVRNYFKMERKKVCALLLFFLFIEFIKQILYM